MAHNFIIVQSHFVEVALATEAQLSLRDQHRTQQNSSLFPNPSLDKDLGHHFILCGLTNAHTVASAYSAQFFGPKSSGDLTSPDPKTRREEVLLANPPHRRELVPLLKATDKSLLQQHPYLQPIG